MKMAACFVGLLLLVTVSCKKDDGALGQQVAATVTDSRAIKEAQAAANQVIRNQTDCEAVKANIDDANRKLDEAEGKLKTSTGKTTLATLKKQVKNIAETCGVR